MNHKELRSAYLSFFQDKGHTIIPPASLVLQNDATTLFTSSGMQPLVPYLSGKEIHPVSRRLVDVQPCIRTQDIEEVGDNRHTTFFEMLGNWSLGEYFKKEQLAWKWEFLTQVLGLSPKKLYVTVFEGNDRVPRDDESAQLWRELGVADDHMYFYGVKSNWWSRSGTPDAMPEGEIGGPDSEIYYDFGEGPHDGPESDEERFLEIGNSVFIEYEKNQDGSLTALPHKNVDFGGGLERLLAAHCGQADIFKTDLFAAVIQKIEVTVGKKYTENAHDMRVIADHMRAATFLLQDGVLPSNKEHGYIVRRLLRRAGMRMHTLMGKDGLSELHTLVGSITDTYSGVYFQEGDHIPIEGAVRDEMNKFGKTLEKGLQILKKKSVVTGKDAFDLFQSYGFPIELTDEIAQSQGGSVDMEEYTREKEKHRALSQSTSASKFKGGLADTSDQVIRFHTATHLLHQALKDVCGESIRQEGSNITQERLRFDVHCDHKITDEEIVRISEILSRKIHENLPVYKHVMPRSEADKLGAASFFKDTYGDVVSVYAIGGEENAISSAYSLEFCGGPHVAFTGEIGDVRIQKVQKIGAELTRFYVVSA